jgi:acyl-CoA reductase-like NAD-dependent aldehyde dehydrogenase
MHHNELAPMGDEWPCANIIWGKRRGSGKYIEQISPLNDSLIQKVQLIDQKELSELLQSHHPSVEKLDYGSLSDFCSRLYEELNTLRSSILETVQWETAFIPSDCEEVVSACLEYVKEFPKHFSSLHDTKIATLHYEDASKQRKIDQLRVPWGTIATILPQSAFLYLALTCLLNGLVTGNRVILRVPTQSARSAALLCHAIEKSQPPMGSISIVMVSARTFTAALCESAEPILVHYLGSSAHAPNIISTCFQAGKHVLIDGDGNAWVWVDKDVSLDYACDVLTSGALRYNGQTCTSINGAIIHPQIYDELKNLLLERWKKIKFGNPLEADIQVGPLLDESQAEHIIGSISDSGATIIAGGQRNRNLLEPTLSAEPREDSELLTQGIFGPALWITPGDIDEFTMLWRKNRYPLCAGILTNSDKIEDYLCRLPGVARLVMNGDPSIEYLYEPWGGYPSSGTNPVSHWHKKYLRTVQIDRPDAS